MLATIKAGNNTLISHEYGVTNRDYWLEKSTYGNGDSIAYTYDDIGRTKSITYDGGTTPDIEYEYDANGSLGVVTDNVNGHETRYFYDQSGRLMRTDNKGVGSGDFRYVVESSYDDINNLTGVTETINGTKYVTNYTYDEDNRVTSVTSGNSKSTVTYDELSRVTSIQRKRNSSNVIRYEYDYWTDGNKTSTQLDTLTIKKNSGTSTYNYTYDAKGNITSIDKDNGNHVVNYYYDNLNQLARVDDPANDLITTYSYDAGGNILNKSEYHYDYNGPQEEKLIDSIDYTYSNGYWGDLLESYDGQIITSDAIGNIIDDGTWEYTWQHGRQLKSMTNGTTTVNFDYDASGMRIRKAIGINVWRYTYNGSTLSHMTDGFNTLFFSYDSVGPMSVNYNGTEYYYVLNAQGDVIAITNGSGVEVVTYEYDPWGKLLYTGGSMASTLGQHNPLRYRGYVYDTETGLYYLQSRYYNPELCRFICADGLASTGQGILGYNMFTYCLNNPANMLDSSGTFSILVPLLLYVTDELFKCVSANNYVYNSMFASDDGYIYNQNKGVASMYRFGLYTSDYNGCGWISTYNASLMLGNRIEPCDIIRHYEESGAVLGGTFGIYPWAITDYFEAVGYEVTVTYDPARFDEVAKANTANIVWYWHEGLGGAHYVAIHWDGSQFIGYNTYSDRNYPNIWGASISGNLNERDKWGCLLISIS